MLKKLAISLLGIFILAPSAFAGTTEETTYEEVEITEDAAYLCGGGCYYDSGIYFSVNTTVEVEADKVYLYGSYTIENAESKKAAVEEMAALYKDIQSKLSEYGTVRRTGVYSYTDWEYTNLYDGSLSIKVDLTNKAKVEDAEDVMYENGFDSWREVVVLNTASGEKLAIPTLKELIQEKKEVYEGILDYSLGSISGLNVYSWTDGTTYNPKTNTVSLSVYADVTYYKD